MPFDAKRDGFVMGEGGAVLVLEERERALARGAHIYAEIAGAASTADAHHITAPAPHGAGAVGCMELALLDAGLTPDAVTHINAHGTSTPANDLPEAEAIVKVFGLPGPAVTSIKGITGHSLGAAGSLEAVALALTIERGLIPPTAGPDRAGPRDPHRRRDRRAPAVDAGAGAVQLVRLRRPQRHPGDGTRPAAPSPQRRSAAIALGASGPTAPSPPSPRYRSGPAADASQQVLRACPSGEILYQTLGQLALLVDQKRRTDDAHVLPAVHATSPPTPRTPRPPRGPRRRAAGTRARTSDRTWPAWPGCRG